MSRIIVAFRAFFAALVSAATAQQIKSVLDGGVLPKMHTDEKRLPEPKTAELPTPARSEAVTLLAALQREARLVDLVKQPLANFSDEEIGAAARNVLGDCGSVLDRFFALAPLASEQEGSPCDVPAGYDPGCYKLSGRIEGSGPFRGSLAHHGWKATAVKLPTWTGSKNAALVIAPAEVEVTAHSPSSQP
jgi:Domain of unknown function (DUF2760)